MLRGDAMDGPETRRRGLAAFGLMLGALLVFGCTSPRPTKTYLEEPQLFTEKEIEALFAGTDFRQIRWISDIPEPVQAVIRDQERSYSSPMVPFMADPGELYNCCCFLFEGVASKRLVFGGQSDNRIFLFFEQGMGIVGPVALCKAYERADATAREVPIEGCYRKSRQDTLVYLKYLMQDWPEATQDAAASGRKS